MALALVILVLAMVLALKVMGSLIGLALMLVMSACVAFTADAMISGKQLRGWLPATGAGLLGSTIGVALMGRHGLILFGVPLIPAFLGSLLVVGAISYFQRSR